MLCERISILPGPSLGRVYRKSKTVLIQIRCTYPGKNHLDEVVHPRCIAFNESGSRYVFLPITASLSVLWTLISRLLGGYDNSIFIWNCSRPGTSPEQVLKTSASREESSDRGIKGTTFVVISGWISALANIGSDVLVAGTFEGSLGVWDLRSGSEPVLEAILHLDRGDTDGGTGVTQVVLFLIGRS